MLHIKIQVQNHIRKILLFQEQCRSPKQFQELIISPTIQCILPYIYLQYSWRVMVTTQHSSPHPRKIALIFFLQVWWASTVNPRIMSWKCLLTCHIHEYSWHYNSSGVPQRNNFQLLCCRFKISFSPLLVSETAFSAWIYTCHCKSRIRNVWPKLT